VSQRLVAVRVVDVVYCNVREGYRVGESVVGVSERVRMELRSLVRMCV
jgi:hypothetical protein